MPAPILDAVLMNSADLELFVVLLIELFKKVLYIGEGVGLGTRLATLRIRLP